METKYNFNQIQQLNEEKVTQLPPKEKKKTREAVKEAIRGFLKQGLEFITKRFSHLEAHKNRNALEIGHTNYKIYHLLCDPATFINAQVNISKNKGALTKGIESDEEVNRFFGLEEAEKIAEKFKQNKYKWSPVRRTWIPKPGKTTKRPIDTPTQQDRIVQEALRGILEAIFEPEFQAFSRVTDSLANNYGFRPAQSANGAMINLKKYAQSCTFGIEGDIKSAYNNVNHDVLLSILGERIQDKKFLKVMKDLLKSGIMDANHYHHSLLGTPQGGIVSPLLFNIYLYPLDLFVWQEILEPLLQSNANKEKPKTNPKFIKLRWERNDIQAPKLEKLTTYKEKRPILKVIRQLRMKAFKLPSRIPESLPKGGIYARYADDWLLLVTATKEEAQAYKEKIGRFIETELKMQLDPEKTLITPLTEGVDFLGFTLKAWEPEQIKIKKTHRLVKIKGIPTHTIHYRRTNSRKLTIYPSNSRIIKNLNLKNYLRDYPEKKKRYFPVGHPTIALLTEIEIVRKYTAVMQGLANYYRDCDNTSILYFASYILQYSCAKTIARRKKITLRQTFKLYGKELKVTQTIYKKGKPFTEEAEFLTYAKIRAGYIPHSGYITQPETNDPFKTVMSFRTKYKLYRNCCICDSNEHVAHHHINSLRSIKPEDRQKDPYKVLRQQLNRLQIPVCHKCHVAITNGSYDKKKPVFFFNELAEAIAAL